MVNRQLRYIKTHAKWLWVLSVLLFICCMVGCEEVGRIKKNYTELWRKVADIERKCEKR